MLDGILSQDNIILIATANSIKDIPPPLYRDGRLTLMNIEYAGRTEIANMINRYAHTQLTEDDIKYIRDDRVIQTLTVKNKCIECIDANMDVSEIIQNINNLKPVNIDKLKQ